VRGEAVEGRYGGDEGSKAGGGGGETGCGGKVVVGADVHREGG
jgi:hypothetical protein